MKHNWIIIFIGIATVAILLVFWKTGEVLTEAAHLKAVDTESGKKNVQLIVDAPSGKNEVVRLKRSGDEELSFVFEADKPELVEQIRAWAEERGLKLSRLDALNAFRLFLSERNLQELLRLFPDIGDKYYQDGVVSLPRQPSENAGGGLGLPFGDNFRNFLGVNGQAEERGRGVTIAVIDAPLLQHDDLSDLSVKAFSADGRPRAAFSASGEESHATSVLSILAGKANGITSDASILSIPIIGENGEASVFDLAQAIVLATDKGADVISISLGGGGSQLLYDAVVYARNAGAIIVAAAGNDSVDQLAYPAAYPEVVAVGAVDSANQYMAFSNSGENLDVTAPGVGLDAAGADNAWQAFSGTSAAVPCVSGIIANYMASHPETTPDETLLWLYGTCTDIAGLGKDNNTGHGTVDAWLMENHEIAGITDAAVTALRLEKTEDNSWKLAVLVQNSGTEKLDTLNLKINIGGNEIDTAFAEVPAFASREYSFILDSAALKGKIPIAATVSVPGIKDMRPRNQTKRAVISME